MSHRTGIWFQMARGRAMIRNRCMREARIWRERMRLADSGYRAAPWGRLYDAQDCYNNMQWCVKRAREANQAWRRYREYDRDERTGTLPEHMRRS